MSTKKRLDSCVRAYLFRLPVVTSFVPCLSNNQSFIYPFIRLANGLHLCSFSLFFFRFSFSSPPLLHGLSTNTIDVRVPVFFILSQKKKERKALKTKVETTVSYVIRNHSSLVRAVRETTLGIERESNIMALAAAFSFGQPANIATLLCADTQ